MTLNLTDDARAVLDQAVRDVCKVSRLGYAPCDFDPPERCGSCESIRKDIEAILRRMRRPVAITRRQWKGPIAVVAGPAATPGLAHLRGDIEMRTNRYMPDGVALYHYRDGSVEVVPDRPGGRP